VHIGAYLAELFRGGIASIPKGEIEAAESLGLRRRAVFRLIILPRAWWIVLPALGGELINILKATSLASAITVIDLVGAANTIRSETFRVYEPLLAVAAIYLLLTICLTRVVGALERSHVRKMRA
ncbi:ABC transporter permease subunit, partial [Mesorhizobium sp. M7D.F.Ca.US.004.03.1.1]|uniref:ABC transporter permease subunit n=1 Tax=Mesorhizobium sp. M7D.F.Ca.US.004.03.1.1 TaxID=2496702 RepID=UPI000FCCB077